MTSTPAEVIAVRLWGTSTSDCGKLAAMAVSALTEAGWVIEDRTGLMEREMHCQEAREWILALEEFIQMKGLQVPTWADVSVFRGAK